MRLGVNINTKKRNCNRCIAFKTVPGNGPTDEKCPLGYPIKQYGSAEPFRNYGVPQEKCPKPLTNSEYVDCLNNYKK